MPFQDLAAQSDGNSEYPVPGLQQAALVFGAELADGKNAHIGEFGSITATFPNYL